MGVVQRKVVTQESDLMEIIVVSCSIRTGELYGYESPHIAGQRMLPTPKALFLLGHQFPSKQ